MKLHVFHLLPFECHEALRIGTSGGQLWML